MKGEVLVIEELPNIPGLELSDEEFRQATERGALADRTDRTKCAWYDRERDRVVIESCTGIARAPRIDRERWDRDFVDTFESLPPPPRTPPLAELKREAFYRDSE